MSILPPKRVAVIVAVLILLSLTLALPGLLRGDPASGTEPIVIDQAPRDTGAGFDHDEREGTDTDEGESDD